MLKQKEKVLIGLIRSRGSWMLPKDFMQPELGNLFVGYEATARLSEVAKEFPNLIETKQEGRFKARRFRVDCTVSDFSELPIAVREATARELYASGYGKCEHGQRYVDNGRVWCARRCGWSEAISK